MKLGSEVGYTIRFEDRTGPYRVTRFNLFPAVEVDGDTAPGYSTGQALAIGLDQP